MCRMGLCFYLLLLLFLSTSLCQRRSLDTEAQLADDEDQRDFMAINILSHSGVLSSLLPPQQRPVVRPERAARPAPPSPKRAPQGSRFALSLDVPTSILSVLIDLAKNHDMRAKAAANAELMARIGKRK